MRPVEFTFVLLLAACVPTSAEPLWRDMIPTPKQAKEIGPAAALPADAVICAPKGGKAGIAAGEINQRLGELGHNALPIVGAAAGEASQASLRICVGNARENAWAAKLIKRHNVKVHANTPGKQGYVIRFLSDGPRTVALLAGSDAQGTLYASVTFRHLIEKRGNEVTLSRVDITDWPDFKFRGFASVLFYASCYAARGGTAAEQIAFLERRMDWLLRHKINVTGDYTYLPRDMSMPAEPHAVFAPVNAYAQARGIVPSVYVSTAVGGQEHKDDPRYAAAALIGHRRMFTWSDEELLQKRAAAVAKYVADNHFGILALHPPDGGGPVDPSQWSKRSAADKKRWRDDQRAEADALVFNIFYRAARKLVPDVKVAYTIYPYSAAYLDYDLLKPRWPTLTPEQCERNGRLYFIEIEKLIPRDAHVVVWNTWKKHMDTFRAIYKGRPMYYWCDFAGRWHRQPYFTAVHRYLGENFYDNDEDIVVPGHDRIRPNLINQLCSVEFSWNRNAPGAAPFNGRYWNMFKDAYEPKIIIHDFAARACRIVWGEEAGPLMAPLFQSNVNPALIAHTGHVLKYENRWRRREGMPDVKLDSKLVAEQVTATEKALPGLLAVVEKRPAMSDFAYRCAVYYYRRVRVLQAAAKLRRILLKAGELLAENQDAEVQKLIDEGNALFEAELPKLAQMAAATQKLPHLKDRFCQGRPPMKFSLLLRHDVDFAQYRRGLLQLTKQLRDKKVKLSPIKHEGIVNAAVYNAAADGGKSIGHEGVLATLKTIPDVSAEYVTDLSISNLARYDVLVYPQCFLGQSSTPYDFHTGLRRYVTEAGGAVWFQHDSIGSPRSEFGARTAFREVSRGTLGRIDSNRVVVVREHPVTAGFKKGHALAHSYFDHWTVKRGRRGIVLTADADGRPVWVAGQVGKGRVLYDGTILLTKENAAAVSTGDELKLITNALRWLAQRKR